MRNAGGWGRRAGAKSASQVLLRGFGQTNGACRSSTVSQRSSRRRGLHATPRSAALGEKRTLTGGLRNRGAEVIGVIWLRGVGVIAVGSVLGLGTAVGMTRSDPDRSSISL